MEKIPKQLNVMYYNEPEPRACKYNFIFSNKLEDWLGSNNKKRRDKWREAKVRQKAKREAQHKLNTNQDG